MPNPWPPGRPRFRRSVALAVLVLLALAPAPPARGHSFVARGWEELVAQAEEIFAGEVTEARSFELPGGLIATDVLFARRRVLKGDREGPLTLRVFGGTVGAVTLKLSGVPRFETGLTYVVFARGNGTDVFPVVGGPHGLFQIRRDPASGQELVFGARGETLWSVPVPAEAFLEAIEEEVRR
jgi:hypothetical protein